MKEKNYEINRVHRHKKYLSNFNNLKKNIFFCIFFGFEKKKLLIKLIYLQIYVNNQFGGLKKKEDEIIEKNKNKKVIKMMKNKNNDFNRITVG